MSVEVDSSEKEVAEIKASVPPSITLSEITFSDGNMVDLQQNDIVVFVGPNNAGKSASLREIQSLLGANSPPCKVVSAIETIQNGALEGLWESMERHSHKTYNSDGRASYIGSGFNIHSSHVVQGWETRPDLLRDFFCKRLKTESRIVDSNPSSSFKVLTEAATRPIQMLYSDSEIERRISSYFKAAFDQDLIVMKAGGNEIPLLVGERLPLREGEDPTTKSYLERLMETATPLNLQGDGMRSFASVILEMLASQAPSILLLDEPEAFLHPPQARLIGEFLAKERRANTQLFVATHSPDVLTGLLDIAPERLRIIRLQREKTINRTKELENETARSIAADPLMKYSSVLSAIFHERAIICESDADCMFYQALLALPAVHGGVNPDVIFLHSSGKHRMAKMADALNALGVPVDVIADVDILSEQGTFQSLLKTLGGDWAYVEPLWRNVKAAIESRKPWLNADAVVNQIQPILHDVAGQDELQKTTIAEIKGILKKASPWGAVKDAGDTAIPSGDATNNMKRLREYLEPLGLWIVPVGELEGFCRTVGGHGPKWVQKVLEEHDLSDDAELRLAREFITAIWSRGRSV